MKTENKMNGSEATLRAAFSEGWAEGWSEGGNDVSSYERGGGLKSNDMRTSLRDEAWEQSDARASLTSTLGNKAKTSSVEREIAIPSVPPQTKKKEEE